MSRIERYLEDKLYVCGAELEPFPEIFQKGKLALIRYHCITIRLVLRCQVTLRSVPNVWQKSPLRKQRFC